MSTQLVSNTDGRPGASVRRSVTRRSFLGLAIGTALAIGLAACGDEEPAPQVQQAAQPAADRHAHVRSRANRCDPGSGDGDPGSDQYASTRRDGRSHRAASNRDAHGRVRAADCYGPHPNLRRLRPRSPRRRPLPLPPPPRQRRRSSCRWSSLTTRRSSSRSMIDTTSTPRESTRCWRRDTPFCS